MTIDSFKSEDKKNDEISLFEEMFEGFEIEFAIDPDGTKTIKALSVAKALEYARPEQAVHDILTRNTEYFEGEIREYTHGAYIQKYLTRKGLDIFLMFSGQSKAKDFKIWAAEKLEEQRTTRVRLSDPYEIIKDSALRMYELANAYQEQQKDIFDIQKRQDETDEKLAEIAEELINITKSQRRKIQNKAKEIVTDAEQLFPELSDKNNKKLWGSIYGLLKDCMDVPRYDEIPRERFDEALKILGCIHKLILSRKLDLNEYITAGQLKTLCRQNALF